MPRDKFRDAAGVVNGGAAYEWAIGHETEDPDSNVLNLDRTALTTGEGFVRQQGAPSPTVKKLHGWIVQPAHKTMMDEFFNACAGRDEKGPRTIWWTDVEGVEREVIITAWEPVREVGRSGGTGLNYVWKYSITMEVIS